MINIAIDGPAGAGKSTVAKFLAEKLGIIYLDTGAMYRATALKFVRDGINLSDVDKIVAKLDEVKIQIKYQAGEQLIFLNGKNVSSEIREHYMSKAASDISKIKEVRLKLVKLQREIAKVNDVVMDGRDIGSYVLPKANFKFFLIADPKVRAKRRVLELQSKKQNAVYEEILADIIERDKNDSTREFAPLKKTDDAIVIDSTNLDAKEVCEQIIAIVKGSAKK